jgi:predicted RNase H-like HicB family nuclease
MKKSSRYLKVVEWSEEDQCFVGRLPGLVFGGVHGDDEQAVYAELCEVAEEWIGILEEDGTPLPPPTAGRKYSGKFNLRSGCSEKASVCRSLPQRAMVPDLAAD